MCYNGIAAVDQVWDNDLETVYANIKDKLVAGVSKRLIAEAKVGFWMPNKEWEGVMSTILLPERWPTTATAANN